MKLIKAIVAWTWCFPQQMLGLAVKICTRAKKHAQGHYVYGIKSGSVSLGTYVFLCEAQKDDEIVLKHEQGHTKQSFILGWLFLPIIGLPSFIWAGCFDWYRKKRGTSYYSFYTEKWADRLGGIKRKEIASK